MPLCDSVAARLLAAEADAAIVAISQVQYICSKVNYQSLLLTTHCVVFH